MNSKTRSLESFYASQRAPAILSHNKDKEVGRVFAEYKDKLVIISGEARKEHSYLIPKTKIHHYGDRRVYLNLSESSLKEFEFNY
jgi:hypothetical protein